jgi:hypothetical protein
MKQLLFSYQILFLHVQITRGGAVIACCVKNKLTPAPKLALRVGGGVFMTAIKGAV